MADRLPILTFHALDAKPDAIAFPPEQFERGLEILHERGHHSIALTDAADLVRDGKAFPDDACVLTFDDGYRSVYEHALPLLQRFGFTATVFVPVGANGCLPRLGGREMLDANGIRALRSAGIHVGAHTMSHCDLTRLSDDQLEAEVRDSKAILEDVLGERVSTFCYPYGQHDRRVREVVGRHFKCACSDRLGLVTSGSDPLAMERVDAYYLRSRGRLAWIAEPWFPWYLRLRALPRRVRRALGFRPGGHEADFAGGDTQ